LDNPLHVILNNSKLAYRIYVILIANKDLTKKIESDTKDLDMLKRNVTHNIEYIL
jgi:hypothetical protein